MVSIGTGRGDPRAWVQAAYLIFDTIAEAGHDGKLPTHPQITAALGVSRFTAARACRELTGMGLIHLVPGHGYYPRDRTRPAALTPAAGCPAAKPASSGSSSPVQDPPPGQPA